MSKAKTALRLAVEAHIADGGKITVLVSRFMLRDFLNEQDAALAAAERRVAELDAAIP